MDESCRRQGVASALLRAYLTRHVPTLGMVYRWIVTGEYMMYSNFIRSFLKLESSLIPSPSLLKFSLADFELSAEGFGLNTPSPTLGRQLWQEELGLMSQGVRTILLHCRVLEDTRSVVCALCRAEGDACAIDCKEAAITVVWEVWLRCAWSKRGGSWQRSMVSANRTWMHSYLFWIGVWMGDELH